MSLEVITCPSCGADNEVKRRALLKGKLQCWRCAVHFSAVVDDPPAPPKPPDRPTTLDKFMVRPPKPLRDHLENLRAGSAYGILRSLIDMAFGIVGGVLLLVALLVLWGSVSVGSQLGTPGTITGALSVIAAFGLILLVLLAVRQAFVLLIDIADATVDSNRRLSEQPKPD